jgi:SAM-dependent methyltransferase
LTRTLQYFLSKNKKLSPNILDVGCADGYHLKHFADTFQLSEKNYYFGTDISEIVIQRAISSSKKFDVKTNVQFLVDDIRIQNNAFLEKMDLIFCSKTIYYVAPEIHIVLDNLTSYLSKNGIFCFIYNQTKDAFSNQWLTYQSLRQKLLERGYTELLINENSRFSPETHAIGIYQAPSN